MAGWHHVDHLRPSREDRSLLTDQADGDVAVVALRIVLQHWISWSKPAVVPRAVESPPYTYMLLYTKMYIYNIYILLYIYILATGR